MLGPCYATWHVMHVVQVQLEAAGMDAGRVDLLPLTPGTLQHLATYNDMDISLDPFPYTGTTTTAESLLMGVPVVTRTGAGPSRSCCHCRCRMWVVHVDPKRAMEWTVLRGEL